MKEEIAILEKELANPSSNTDVDQTEFVLEEYKYKLAKQEELLKTTPEDRSELEEASKTFKGGKIEAYSEIIDNKQSSLVITGTEVSYNVEYDIAHDYILSDRSEKELEEYQHLPEEPTSIDENTALSLAKSTVADIDVTHLEVSSVEKLYTIKTDVSTGIAEDISRSPAYKITFSRELGGTAEVVPVYESESITIIIYESGVKSFDWYNPKEFVEEVKGDGELLPFEDIEEIFKNQVFISNPPINSAVNENIIGIDNVDFSMMTVPKQGANDEYYLIPVWNFSGYNEMSIMYTQESLGLTDEQAADDPFLNQEFNSVNYHCFLTINAIDGTVIDMNSWY